MLTAAVALFAACFAALAFVFAVLAIFCTLVTFSFVACNCLPVTASLLVVESVASANPLIFLLLAFTATLFLPISTPFAVTLVTLKLSARVKLTLPFLASAETAKLLFVDSKPIVLSEFAFQSATLFAAAVPPALIVNVPGFTTSAKAYNCAPLIASVDVADTSPAATFLSWRFTVPLPNETTPPLLAPVV